MLLDYAATYHHAIILYNVRDIVLHVDSARVYLTMPEAIRFYYGHFYLTNWPLPRPVKPTPKRNSPIYTEFQTIQNMVSTPAEAETCGTFNNRK